MNRLKAEYDEINERYHEQSQSSRIRYREVQDKQNVEIAAERQQRMKVENDLKAAEKLLTTERQLSNIYKRREQDHMLHRVINLLKRYNILRSFNKWKSVGLDKRLTFFNIRNDEPRVINIFVVVVF